MTEDHRKTALEYAARAKEAGETEFRETGEIL